MSFTNRIEPTAAFRFMAVMVIFACLPVAAFVAGCDQGGSNGTGPMPDEPRYDSEQEFLSDADEVYDGLRVLDWDWHILKEHTSDQTMVPTRGRNWDDGGNWRVLTQHKWKASHPFIKGAWEDFYTGVEASNTVLKALNNSEDLPTQFTAEMRFVRAFYCCLIMDSFGFAPIVVEQGRQGFGDFPTSSASESPPQNTRRELFNFVVQELVGEGCTADADLRACVNNPSSSSILAHLPAAGSVPYGRATRGAGYAMLARILLNAEVYAHKTAGPPSASGIGSGPAHYGAAEAAANEVLAMNYALTNSYFSNFTVGNARSSEIIFPIQLVAENEGGGLDENVGMDFPQRVLHYNHPIPGASGSNGWTTIRAFYEAHAVQAGPDGELGTRDDTSQDDRIQQYVRGEQFKEPSSNCIGNACFSDPASGVVRVRGGTESNPAPQLAYTLDIPVLAIPPSASARQKESPGLRPLKYELDPFASGPNADNDIPLIRLAEIYLIKAEAKARTGDLSGAVDALNSVRERAGLPGYGDPDGRAVPSSETDVLQAIIQERGFEFMLEGLRRQDLIRYEYAHNGTRTLTPYYVPTFTSAWLFKKDKSATFRTLFPIPADLLGTNPNLKQIQGY